MIPHEFVEDVADGSMCMCGIPALTHDAVVPAPQQPLSGDQEPDGLPALTGAVRPADRVLRICPECAQTKCGNCDGTAWNDVTDEVDTCECPKCAS